MHTFFNFLSFFSTNCKKWAAFSLVVAAIEAALHCIWCVLLGSITLKKIIIKNTTMICFNYFFPFFLLIMCYFFGAGAVANTCVQAAIAAALHDVSFGVWIAWKLFEKHVLQHVLHFGFSAMIFMLQKKKKSQLWFLFFFNKPRLLVALYVLAAIEAALHCVYIGIVLHDNLFACKMTCIAACVLRVAIKKKKKKVLLFALAVYEK